MSGTSKIRPDAPDDDNPAWTAQDLAQAKPAVDYYGSERLARLIGRPPRLAETRKVSTTLRLDPDVLEAIKATGKGWQTRINQELRERYLGRK